MDVTTLTNQDPAFYSVLGPFLAAKEVHHAIGGVPWDEPTKTWIVLTQADQVVAFCAINQGSRRTLLESFYLLPGHEGQALQLAAAAVRRFGHDRDLHTTVRHALVPALEQAGFKQVKELKNFATLVRPASVRGR